MRIVFRAVLALTLVASLVFAAPVAAQIAMRWWVVTPVTTTYYDENSCHSTGRVGHQELGRSGITRLRARFQLRTQYDPGHLPYVPATTRWFYTLPFPDDGRSLYHTWSYGFRYKLDRTYWIQATLIGERPGLWRPDRKIKANLGEVICYTVIDAGS